MIPGDRGRTAPVDRLPVLQGYAVCGGCGEPLGYQDTAAAVYLCRSGCLPPVPADHFEQRVARAVMERIWTPEALVRLAAAQDLLCGLGYQMRQMVPVSLKHALHQWSHEYDPSLRRAVIHDQVLAVVLHPGRQPAAEGEVFVAWRQAKAHPAGN